MTSSNRTRPMDAVVIANLTMSVEAAAQASAAFASSSEIRERIGNMLEFDDEPAGFLIALRSGDQV